MPLRWNIKCVVLNTDFAAPHIIPALDAKSEPFIQRGVPKLPTIAFCNYDSFQHILKSVFAGVYIIRRRVNEQSQCNNLPFTF